MRKTKFIFHAMRTKNVSTIMISSFISILKDIITWIKKSTKRKVNKSSKKRCFSESATFDQKRKNNMNQFTKRKRFDEFLKDETIVKSQKSFRIFISTSSNEYDSKINIVCLQKNDLWQKHFRNFEYCNTTFISREIKWW